MLCHDVETNPGLKSSFRKSSPICHWKSNGISAQSYAKVSLLTTHNVILKFDVICGSETFLNSGTAPNDTNFEKLGYNKFRVDHPTNCKRGAVRVFYKATLLLRVLNILNLN